MTPPSHLAPQDGSLLLELGGVGHKVAGGCKVKNEDAEAVVGQLIERITADG